MKEAFDKSEEIRLQQRNMIASLKDQLKEAQTSANQQELSSFLGTSSVILQEDLMLQDEEARKSKKKRVEKENRNVNVMTASIKNANAKNRKKVV